MVLYTQNPVTRTVDRLAVILVALAAMLWGTDSIFRIPLLQHLGKAPLMQSTQLVFMEHLVLTLAVIPILWINRAEIARLTRVQWLAVAAIGVGASALATVLFTMSFGYGHFIETLLLQKTQPVIAILLAAIFLRERLSSAAYVLIPIAILGAYLIAIPDPWHPQNAWADFHVAAALLALGASALWGAATVLGRYTLNGLRFTTVTALRFTTGLPALLVLLFVIGGPAGFQNYRVADAPLYLGVALVPGLIAMLLYYRGLASTPASMATLAELAFPITGVLVNLFLVSPRQSLTLDQVAGIVVLWGALGALDWINARRPARLERGVQALALEGGVA